MHAYTQNHEIVSKNILRNTTISFNLKVFRIVITTKCSVWVFRKTQKISTNTF